MMKKPVFQSPTEDKEKMVTGCIYFCPCNSPSMASAAGVGNLFCVHCFPSELILHHCSGHSEDVHMVEKPAFRQKTKAFQIHLKMPSVLNH
jgi:hypothetical protein